MFYDDLSSTDRKEYFKKSILDQLKKCPRSLIIIDEYNQMNSDVRDDLISLLDATVPTIKYDGEDVSLTQAVYIFITDFGKEGRTSNLSLDQIRDLIHYEVLSSFKDTKQTTFLNYVVPFGSITQNSCRDYINYLLTHIEEFSSIFKDKQLVVSDSVKEEIFNKIFKALQQPEHIHTNYRGVFDLFKQEIIVPLAQFINYHPDQSHLQLVFSNSNFGVLLSTKTEL